MRLLVVELDKRCKEIGSLLEVDFGTFLQVVVDCIVVRKEAVVGKVAGRDMELVHMDLSCLEEAAFHVPFLLKIQQARVLLDQSRKTCGFS